MIELLSVVGDRLTHVVSVLLVGVGLFIVVDDENLVKKVVGLNVLQTGVFLFFITSAYRADGAAALVGGEGPYVNPLPQVLILTAIVVGVSVTAVALALVVRLYDAVGTLREDVVRDVLAAEDRNRNRNRNRAGEPMGPTITDGGEERP